VAYTAGLHDDLLKRRVAFLFGKTLVGLGCGVLISACQTYISEIAPKSIRGVLLGFYAFTVVRQSRTGLFGFETRDFVLILKNNSHWDTCSPLQLYLPKSQALLD
jgi:hypothetical protein